ncbi:MAG: NADH-quinone oxidoreductase subunit L [Candidatus Nanopelagicales bacterium]|jgi:formate dehydrogenase iron-sulfur subunit|nr:NADH-quinone oxidoreductase subunit L [Candidatus Nanopelagicales bacterium]MDP4907127.1 NADH-quinone oxidoreductase subunit L [Candidatus Nanopelagicales bacterium]MDP4907964.1 NADH-quinone oxidoreductase subunit L [Candidatus Nanopelagicales bacterium]
MTRIYVPRDSAARSVGADEVARAVENECGVRGINVEIVRNGSRGLLWLEPLVEVETSRGRMGYGPVTPGDVPGLIDGGFLEGAHHELALGVVDDIPWLARQQRVSFARVGIIDPLDLDAYRATGGLRGLQRALQESAEEIVGDVLASGLRGRGGAGFPAGIKWRTVLEAESLDKYICCNADEGDSGTFADRMLMEGDPFTLLEGMAIAGVAVGATRGLIYVRSEYPDAIATLRTAVDIARVDGWLGVDVMGTGRTFDIRVVEGAGSYVCGEETAMLESLEGKRGMVRPKPPIPALKGLFGQPTLVHNVLTLSAVPSIIADGPGDYQALGVDRSRGTQVFQLAGNLARGGIVEIAFGVTLRELIEDFGGGTLSGRPLRAVQVGGPLGAYLPAEALDVSMDYEALADSGGLLGHGGVVAFDDSIDMATQARFAMEFCAVESCGKCTPCRIGSTRGIEVIDKITAGVDRELNLVLLEDLCATMTDGSLCAMGGLTPLPVLSALAHFPEDFHRPPEVTP